MIDYKKIIADIANQNILNITTKELKKYGLNDYYIKKAVDKDLLTKSGRGKYRVIQINNIENGKNYFFKFVECTLNKDFEEAFKYLYKANSMQNNLYGNNYRICFLLLKPLVSSTYDFSFIDDILEFTDMNDNASEFNAIFTKFRYAVMSANYIEAYANISKLKDLHYKRNRSVPVNINVFYTLTTAVIEKQELKITKRAIPSFDHIWSIFKIYLRKEQYGQALEFLENRSSYIPMDKKDLFSITVNLLQCYLDVKNNQTILKKNTEFSNEHSYNYYEQYYKNIFDKNYLEAYKDINALMYYYPHDENFQLYQMLLKKIIEQNKINIQNQGVVFDKIEKSNDIKINPSIHLSMGNIRQLVYSKDYATLRNLFEDNKINNKNYGRLTAFLYKFLMQMEKYENDLFFVLDVDHTYKHTYCFNRFFEALRFNDYEEAHAMCVQCKEHLSTYGKDTEEFSIYEMVLEDLIVMKNKALLKRKINTQVDNVVFAKKDILPNLGELEQLLFDRIESNSSEEGYDNSYDILALNIIDTIFMALENPTIVRDSFASFPLNSSNLVNSFMEALNTGNYVSAFLITNEKNFHLEIKEHENKKNLLLYKKLLQVLNRRLIHNETISGTLNNDNRVVQNTFYNEKIVKIETLRRFIKYYQINEALAYYHQNYDYFKDVFSSDLHSILMANFYLFANQDTQFLEEHKTFYKKKGNTVSN